MVLPPEFTAGADGLTADADAEEEPEAEEERDALDADAVLLGRKLDESEAAEAGWTLLDGLGEADADAEGAALATITDIGKIVSVTSDRIEHRVTSPFDQSD
ncbi:hypothetical protein EW146_g560 [Bondarzewia mesenterica]|uniref:Uncharacterized protein n=1 Tax=Bondarzewia mesenterica TaxID=1095465 RepID=A0A4S4M6X7_9AGAM|nr:hypothetical protein EW146_g560 [Bondarzewia mesenterica]